MLRTIQSGWVVGCAVVVLSTVVGGASAAPITSITGDYDGIRPISGSSATTFTFTDDTFQTTGNGQALPLQAGFATAHFIASSLNLKATEININLSSFPNSSPATLSGNVGITTTLTIYDAGMVHTAVFTLSSAKLTRTPNGQTNTITAVATWQSDNFTSTGTADLSAFHSPGTGTFTATFTGITTNPPSISIGGIVSPSASGGVADWDNTDHSVTGHFVIVPNVAAAIPEPASLALWGAAAAAMAWLRRRRAKN